ncbi:MAG: hypothetical protein RLZZ187_2546 [Pseudomonadota bacterium]
MDEQVSRPQLLWPGLFLFLLLAPAALVGGLSTSAVAQPLCSISTPGSGNIINSGSITTSVNSDCGIYSIDPNAAITNTNSGTITMSGLAARAIVSTGANAVIINSGTIRTASFGAYGIASTGANAVIINSGTIRTEDFVAYGIASSGHYAVITNTGVITTDGDMAFVIYSLGANAVVTNSGTITTSGDIARGIFSTGANATITNSGTITTSGNDAHGIYFVGDNATIINSGTITTSGNDAHGIYFVGDNATIINSGTITAGAGYFGIRVDGGSVVTLTNAQGGNTPLTYSGALPTNYNVVVRSASEFGRLAVISPSGTMTFGVDNSSTLPDRLRTTVRYTNVLAGLAASHITNSGTIETLGRYHWMLTAGTGANNWDLLAWMFSPDPVNTRLALQSNANAAQNVLAQRAATTTFALDYDCSVFDQYGLCVSVGFRNTQMGSNYADSGETAGLLTAAYRVTPEFRIGGFIDQNLVSQSPVGVDPKNTQPMLGAFAVYQENPSFVGLTLRAALAYQEGDLRITRPESADTEAGTGRTRTTALAFGGEVAYGFPLDGTWVAQPYAGMRRSDSQRRGYTETTSDSVEYPITYNRFGQQVNSATAGLRLRGSITPEFSLTFGAGVEHDLNSKVDRYSGRSTIPDLETFSINASQQQNETRAVGSAGMRYMIASNQALAFDASVRQMPYGNDPSVTTMLRYSIGF